MQKPLQAPFRLYAYTPLSLLPSETPRNAVIMLGTVFLYLVVQVPALFGHSRDPIVDLVGLILAALTLAAYCIYQVGGTSWISVAS